MIGYASAYGNTKVAVDYMVDRLKESGQQNIVVYDLARCDHSNAICDAFRYSKLVLASITYNAGMSPFMDSFINGLKERNYQNRLVACIENNSWAPMANKAMLKSLELCKNLSYVSNHVTITSSLDETSREAINQLVKELK